MDGINTPELLMDGGQSPHDFSLRPSDARKISGADLILWVGDELETPLAKTMEAEQSRRRVVSLMDIPGIERWGGRGSGEVGHGDHDHQHTHDPHIWLSPRNAEVIVNRLVEELSRLDPSNRARYFGNGLKTTIRLRQLDRSLRHVTEPISRVPYLVFHDAYQYFERRYGLNRVGSVTLSPGRTPGARHLTELRKRIEQQKVRCIFSEPQFQPKLVGILLQDTPIQAGVLDPIGADIPAGREAYFQLMRELAASLHRCLH